MLQITVQLPFSAKFFSPPPKKPSTREREYLLTSEINAMIHAAKKVGRHGVRAIQDYLGHKNIHHTVRYTQMSPQRFENFWTD